MMKYFVLNITYASGKKGAFLTNNADLTSALIEFKNEQMKNSHGVLEDKSYSTTSDIILAELVRVINFV